MFSIGDCLDDTVSSVSNEKETVCLTLKPRQPVTLNVDFRGMSLQSFGGNILMNFILHYNKNIFKFFNFD